MDSTSGNLYGWSDEFKKFYSSGYQCPQCDEALVNKLGLITVNFYSVSGKKIPLWKLPWMIGAEFGECPKQSYYRWKIKDSSQPITSEKLEILGIVETDRVEESLGSDRKIIDNAKSSVKLTRRFSLSKEWSRVYSIEYEKEQVSSTEFNIGINEITSIKTGFEETIRKQYSISEETKEVYSEEVEIEVPGFTKLSLVFQWKRIWQCGFVKFRNQNNEELRVPFRVVVGVTFDQLQVDEKN